MVLCRVLNYVVGFFLLPTILANNIGKPANSTLPFVANNVSTPVPNITSTTSLSTTVTVAADPFSSRAPTTPIKSTTPVKPSIKPPTSPNSLNALQNAQDQFPLPKPEEPNEKQGSEGSNEISNQTGKPQEPGLPERGAAEEEHQSSMSLFFVLGVLGLCILLIHFLLKTKLQFLPESVAVVFLGAIIGLVLRFFETKSLGDWQQEEAFKPTVFFLVLLPPIIFESGYNLHKGNFFANIGSILLFAVFGTFISSVIVGCGLWALGQAEVSYHLDFREAFAFGSLISAVDPIATLAIFHAMDVEPLLTMLVFGESILNDAVAIVLTRTVLESTGPGMENAGFFFEAWTGIQKFFLMFFGSAGIGVASALVSALLLKYVDLRSNPSLEFGMMLVFCYAPYGLAEGMHLSGIMAILFCGVVMSHYTHYNLSPVTQITMQQSLRTVAFMAETCVFAYLGLAIFSFRHILRLDLILWGIILILLGRAANIYPLSWVSNYFREVQISKTNMFIMWFSGLRGAIAYALALHLEFNDEKRHVLVTTTLTIVLFTILVLGGSTMPIMKFLLWRESQQLRPKRKRRKREHVTETISLSKTREIGKTLDSEHYSEMTEEEALSDVEGSGRRRTQLRGFLKWDAMYFRPLFTRKFTPQELKDCKTQMTNLTDQWYAAVKTTSPLLPSDDEEVEILNVQSL